MTGWKIGETVPWSVSWTGEQAFSAQASRDFPGSMELMQAEHPGEGIPRFASLHVTRQRCGMIGQLCHVCGRRTTARDRYVFPVESGGFVAYGGDMRYAGTVPPVHLRCAQKARAACPHLRHALADPIAYPGEDSQVVPNPDVPEGMADIVSRLSNGGRIVSACLRIYGPRFSRTVEQLRKARGGRSAETWRAFTA